MPKRAPKPCSYPGCTHYATKGARCDRHQREAWATSKGRSRHQRGYGSRWERVRSRVLYRDAHLCQACARAGLVKRATHVDHVLNKASGGGDDYENLEAICVDCHKSKTAQEGAEASRRARR